MDRARQIGAWAWFVVAGLVLGSGCSSVDLQLIPNDGADAALANLDEGEAGTPREPRDGAAPNPPPAAPDAGADADACVPRVCLPKSCGQMDDDCGGTLRCGKCRAPDESCGGAGTPNECGVHN